MRIKKLEVSRRSMNGRNNTGQITQRYLGGRISKKMAICDFSNFITNLDYTLLIKRYDAYRNVPLNLKYFHKFGLFNYVLATKDSRYNTIKNFNKNNDEINMVKNLEIGSFIYNLEPKPLSGGIYIRSGGCFGVLIRKFNFLSIPFVGVKMPSNKIIYVHEHSSCSVGKLSSINLKNRKLLKAGVNRNKGKRPSVRGVAMNPIDHPHGGGEGKTSGGQPSVSRWGVLTKGFKTTKLKKIRKRKEFLFFLNKKHRVL